MDVKNGKRPILRRMLRIAAIGLLLAGPLLVLPGVTHASLLSAVSGIDFSPAGIATIIFRAIAYVFNYIFGLVYLLGSYLVQVTLNLNNQILSHQNQIVTIGWTVLRDVANLGFVLVMIIVAVATIFRYEKFSAKTLLPKLIAAAIIVNFSLTIAGAFLVFSNTLTNVFLQNKIGGGADDFATTISVAFAPQTLYLPSQNPPPPNPADQGGAFSGFSETTLSGIAGLIFSMVFTLIAALVMFALALMLIARYVILSILLLTAPITWLFWVFPPLNDIFHSWWKKFMQWVFFLPAVAFFIYLALTSVQFFDGLSIDSSGVFSGSAISDVFNQGVKMILLCGLMLGGLIVANNMGIAGAGGAMNLAKSVGNSTKKWAKDRASGLAQRTGRRILTSGVDDKGKTAFQRLGDSKVGKMPFIGAALTGLAGASARAKSNNKKDFDEAQKKTEGRSGEEAVNILKRQITGGRLMTDAELAAWGTKAASEGKWGDLSDALHDQIINAVKRTNSEDKLLGSQPQLYERFGLDANPDVAASKAVNKYVQDASKLKADTFRTQTGGVYQIAINLRNSHLSQIANSGTQDQRDAVVDAVKSTIGARNLQGIEQMLRDIDTAKRANDTQALNNAKAVLDQTVRNLTDNQRKAYAVYQNIEKNPNWPDVSW